MEDFNYRIEEKYYADGTSKFYPQMRLKTYAPFIPEDGIQRTNGWISLVPSELTHYNTIEEARERIVVVKARHAEEDSHRLLVTRHYKA